MASLIHRSRSTCQDLNRRHHECPKSEVRKPSRASSGMHVGLRATLVSRFRSSQVPAALSCELRNQRDTSKLLTLVWFLDLKFYARSLHTCRNFKSTTPANL